MYKIILILVPIITIYLFIDIYKKITENDNNKIIKNLEEYAKKEKIKQQESKILAKRTKRRARNKKENINVYN
jgi:uncharacterized protein YxeA